MIFIISIILTIVIFNLYHKMFNITYFGFTGLMKEIVVMFVISMFICTAILN